MYSKAKTAYATATVSISPTYRFTTYTVTETNVPGYDKSSVIIEANIQRTGPETRNNDLVVNNLQMTQRWHNGNLYSRNDVIVTNYRSQPTPMGALVDNAPFIGLISLAVVSGVIGFMKLRKREYEDDMA